MVEQQFEDSYQLSWVIIKWDRIELPRTKLARTANGDHQVDFVEKINM